MECPSEWRRQKISSPACEGQNRFEIRGIVPFVIRLAFTADAEPLCTTGRSPGRVKLGDLRVSEDEIRSSELSFSVAARVCALANHGTVR